MVVVPQGMSYALVGPVARRCYLVVTNNNHFRSPPFPLNTAFTHRSSVSLFTACVAFFNSPLSSTYSLLVLRHFQGCLYWSGRCHVSYSLPSHQACPGQRSRAVGRRYHRQHPRFHLWLHRSRCRLAPPRVAG